MKNKCMVLLTTLVVIACGLSNRAVADPCGMVPPIYTGPGVPIVRTGLQQTYVFYKDGVETFVIKPGFQGRVEDFGMLIPFPAPPELRKVSDNIFEQVDNAIDPPEVLIDLMPIMQQNDAFQVQQAQGSGSRLDLYAARREKVVVLKEEAVGMYLSLIHI